MPIRFALISKPAPAVRIRLELPGWTFRLSRLASRAAR
jgi:hypothetical protein